MLHFRNDTDRDLALFRMHFAMGVLVAVDETKLDPAKLAHLRRNLTEVGAPAPVPVPVAAREPECALPVAAAPVVSEAVQPIAFDPHYRRRRRARSEG